MEEKVLQAVEKLNKDYVDNPLAKENPFLNIEAIGFVKCLQLFDTEHVDMLRDIEKTMYVLSVKNMLN